MERIDPARDGDERTMLRGTLELQRAIMLSKLDGLSDVQVAQPHPPSDLTLSGLIKHLALAEDHWFQHNFAGQPLVEPWASVDWDDDLDWEFHTATSERAVEVREQYLTSIERSNAVFDAAPSLDDMSAPTDRDNPKPFNLRWVTIHMIEETARHAGHADLIREAIDGSVED
jgi:hypothetical protein